MNLTERRRAEMVELQLVGRGMADAAVLEAMRRVPREEFVAEAWRSDAYEDRPLPIELLAMVQQTSTPLVAALSSVQILFAIVALILLSLTIGLDRVNE